MNKLAIKLFLVLFCSNIWAVPSSNQVMEVLQGGDNKKIESIAMEVLENNTSVDSLTLLLTVSATMMLEKFEDSAFLYYVARARHVEDRANFPPAGKGGNSPSTLFGAVASNMPIAFNPLISKDPSVMLGIAKRIEAWRPLTKTDYSPGWEYEERKMETEKYKGVITGTVKYLQDVSKMLENSEYQSLLEEFRVYSQNPKQDDSKYFVDLSNRGQQFEENWGTKFIFHQY